MSDHFGTLSIKGLKELHIKCNGIFALVYLENQKHLTLKIYTVGLSATVSFGKVFHLFFKQSKVERKINSCWKQLNRSWIISDDAEIPKIFKNYWIENRHKSKSVMRTRESHQTKIKSIINDITSNFSIKCF